MYFKFDTVISKTKLDTFVYKFFATLVQDTFSKTFLLKITVK